MTTSASQRPRGPYGHELILDLHGCESTTFTRTSLNSFFTMLCELIDMEKCEVFFWDDEGVDPEERQTLPHTKGISAVCFILTSSIVVHTLDILGSVYVNVFSCKEFADDVVESFAKKWFGAGSSTATSVTRTMATRQRKRVLNVGDGT